jgi:POT family proton-dependent oligopeptide transporter
MSQELVVTVYNQIGWIAVGVGVVVLLLSPIVKKWMHLDTLRDDNVADDLVGGSEVGEPQAAGMHPEMKG